MNTADTSRRRRTVVVAGHHGDAGVARAHLDDPDPSVRSSALRALRRCDALATTELDTALDDPDAAVRRTAAELAALDTTSALVALLDDVDDTVVEMSAWAIGEWGPSAGHAVPELCRITRSHDDALCREAAAAALGAIGDPSALPTILAALEDKATVRRRATIALAPFAGPEVDAALERCLDDRDWQVRQVAEDLLDRRSGD